jgi:fibronectin-binding autotransporter adhesin
MIFPMNHNPIPPRFAPHRAHFLALTLLAALFAPHARAQVVTWNNTGGTTDFNTATNWAGDSLPDSASVATFATVASVQPAVSASISVSALNFSTTASGGYIVSSTGGAALTLLSTGTGAGGAINTASTSGSNQIAVPVILGAPDGATQTFTAAGTGGLLLNSVISSTSNVALSLSAAANINLFQINTYTGPTTISGPASVVVTSIGNAGANGNLGAGATINLGLGGASGTLLYGGAGETTDRTINLNGNGAGATLNVIGSHALVLSSDLTATGTGSKTLTLTGSSSAASTIQGAIVDGNGITSVEKTGNGLWNLSGVSSYTGTTTIFAGILGVSTLADGGSASSLGASGNIASNLQLLLGGTLKYTGAAISTDRLFSVGLIGGTIDASGTGALNFTNSGSLGVSGGARTLTLTGTNTGANTLAAAIGENGSATSLTKNGAGTWLLSGASTYTGATTVNAGTLSLTGLLGDTAITVNSGATFGGTGTAGGSLTLNSGGILSPGSSLGTLTVGSLLWNGGATLAFELGTGNFSDQLVITGVLGKSGSDFYFDFMNTGAAGNTYTLLTFDSIDGVFSAGDLSYINLGSGLTGEFAFTAHSLEFSIAAVPEPATYAALLGAVALAAAGWHRHRRRTVL